MYLSDSFECSLELKSDAGKPIEVFSANIQRIELMCHSYGFKGQVEVTLKKDTDLTIFYAPDIIDISLKLKSGRDEDDLDPIDYKGVVLTKHLSQKVDSATLEVDRHTCSITFCDPAAAIWTKHFPIQIFTHKTMKGVIDEYISDRIDFNVDSGSFNDEKDLIALSLGADPRNEVDFYSFLMWRLREENEVWDYDYEQTKYFIRKEKEKIQGDPINLPYELCSVAGDGSWGPSTSIVWPEQSRKHHRVVNSYVKTPINILKEAKHVFDAIRHDHLLNSAVEGLDAIAAELLTYEPHTDEHLLKIGFSQYPPMGLIPGKFYTLQDMPGWGDIFPVEEGSNYRLRTVHLVLSARGPTNQEKPAEEDPRAFSGSVEATFETEDEVAILRPFIRVPTYPFPIEGKVFTKRGKEKDLNYEIEERANNQDYYTVKIPWTIDEGPIQEVVAPFEPTYTNGQTYNPLLKDQRVMLHFDLFTAKIVEVLDWFASAKVTEYQGNKTVFAPEISGKSQTIMQHTQKNEGDPLTFLIQRTGESQVQLIRMEKDGFHIIVHEEGEGKDKDPQCEIWMDNESKMIIKTKKEKQEQNITIKPGEISTLCDDGSKNSTIIQKPDSITIKCDSFKLETKETELTSEKTTKVNADKLNLKGKTGTTMEDGATIKINASSVSIA